MANLTHISTTSGSMHLTPLVFGQVVYCADTQESYYDTNNGVRMQLTNVTHILTEAEREDLRNEKEDWLYVVFESNKFYKYSKSKNWKEIFYTDDMYNIIDIYEELVPGTITQFGNKLAPKTIASQVYTDRGERVQDVLDTISKIGYTVTNYTIPNDGMNEFPIPIPFEKYFELNNFMDVYIGSTWVDPKRYAVIGNNLKLLTSDASFAKDRDISFKFYYNTLTAPSDTIYQVHGAYMVNGSIPIRKLERYSDDYKLNDPTSVATSKALRTLYDNIDMKISSVAGNLIAHAVTDPSTDGRNLKTTIGSWNLVDNSTIYLRLSQDLLDEATLSVNGGPAYPIYLNYKEKVRGVLKAGDVLNITFSAIYNKFFVNAQTAYGLVHYSYTYEAIGGESEILIDIPDWEPLTDKLLIYQNNIRLIENINYTFSGRNIVLTGYAADIGDVFVVELERVSGNGLPIDGNTIMAPVVFWNDVIFNGYSTFNKDVHINADLYIDGELKFDGGAVSDSIIKANQFEATIKTEDGPPFIVHSEAKVDHLNADMVDGYHEYDLARPDPEIEFVIDGESDIMDSSVNIQLSAFYARVNAVTDRMLLTHTAFDIKIEKRNFDDEIDINSVLEDDPLYNANVRDTIEDIIHKLDNLRMYLLDTDYAGPGDSGSFDDINNSDGSDIDPTVPFSFAETPFKSDYVTLVNLINDEIFEVEEIMLRAMYEDEDIEEYKKEYEKIKEDHKNAYIDYIKTENNTEAIKARYILNQGKRMYPITHRNAVIGLPTTDLATQYNLDAAVVRIAELESLTESQGREIVELQKTLAEYKKYIWDLYKEVFYEYPTPPSS